MSGLPEVAQRFDVIVVGAGFAGSLTAKRLGERGRRVLVLEAGPAAAEHRSAVEAFQRAAVKAPAAPYPASPAAPVPDLAELRGTPAGFEADGYLVQRGRLPYASAYLRTTGGTGLPWTGLTPRMHPEDFRAGDFGHGRNWPLGYAELEPYYRDAERELGVAADAREQRDLVGLPLGAGYEFPLLPVPRSYLDRVLAQHLDGRRVQDPAEHAPTALRVVGTPHARNTRPNPAHSADAGFPMTGGSCQGHASCIPICPAQAKYTPLRTQDRWRPTVVLRSRAVVTRVVAAPNGQVTGVEYRSYDESGVPLPGTWRAEADIVVLAAHAIENAKLLLASGLANGSDQVGRNLMDHPVLLTHGLMPQPVGPYRGPGSTSGLEGFRFGPARRHRAAFRIEIGNWGWLWAEGPPEGEVAALLRSGVFGADLRRRLGDRIGRQFALQFEMDQPADPANRVTLDPNLRDALGQPRPVVSYDLSDYVKEGMASAKAVSDQIFGLLGAEDHTDYRPGPDSPTYFEHRGRPYTYRGAGHGAGTHIMGSSPHSSVVDPWQRCWDHPNLYAVGCGSMPGVATANPSLTMAALALRSADRIERHLASIRRAAPVDRPRTSPADTPAARA